MKLYEILEPANQINEDLLNESIITTLQASYKAVKDFANNISSAKDVHKSLKSLDGSKTFSTAKLKEETIRIRLDLSDIISLQSQKVQAKLHLAIKKAGGSSVSGAYLSRNYYKDFIIYSMIMPIANIANGTDASKAAVQVALNKALDKLIGMVLVAITGIPNIDDVKDVADVGKSMVKATNSIANKINDMKPDNTTPS